MNNSMVVKTFIAVLLCTVMPHPVLCESVLNYLNKQTISETRAEEIKKILEEFEPIAGRLVEIIKQGKTSNEFGEEERKEIEKFMESEISDKIDTITREETEWVKNLVNTDPEKYKNTKMLLKTIGKYN